MTLVARTKIEASSKHSLGHCKMLNRVQSTTVATQLPVPSGDTTPSLLQLADSVLPIPVFFHLPNQLMNLDGICYGMHVLHVNELTSHSCYEYVQTFYLEKRAVV